MTIIAGFMVAALIVACAYLNVQLGKARLETAEWRRLAIEADRRARIIEDGPRITHIPDDVRKAAEAAGVVLPTIKISVPMPAVKPPKKAGRAKA